MASQATYDGIAVNRNDLTEAAVSLGLSGSATNWERRYLRVPLLLNRRESFPEGRG